MERFANGFVTFFMLALGMFYDVGAEAQPSRVTQYGKATLETDG